MSAEKDRLLERLLLGQISEGEARRLFDYALDDDATLESLENVGLINLTTRTQADRTILARALERQALLERANTRASRWRWVATAWAAAALAVAITLWPIHPAMPTRVTPAFDQPTGSPSVKEADMVFALRSPPQATVTLNRPGVEPTYQAGDEFWIEVLAHSDANLFVYERRVGTADRKLFPNAFQPARLSKNDRVRVASSGREKMTIEGPPGPRSLRFLMLPPELDISADKSEVERRATLIELRYSVRVP